MVQVIGIRYELNDPYICVIGKVKEQYQNKQAHHVFEK